jgi:hypothetical protein
MLSIGYRGFRKNKIGATLTYWIGLTLVGNGLLFNACKIEGALIGEDGLLVTYS